MLFKKEGKYSFLDLKMGDCTVLRSAESNSFAKFEKRDSDTTSKEYGFRLTGFTLYNYYKYKDKYVIQDKIVEDFDILGKIEFVK